jgi:hypothetical protein
MASSLKLDIRWRWDTWWLTSHFALLIPRHGLGVFALALFCHQART